MESLRNVLKARRRRALLILVVLGGLALPAAAASARPPDAAGSRRVDTRPNIVLITSDDQTVADLQVMTKTRRLLADRGTTFTNSYSPYPTCCPARASILTGQYAHNHGVWGNNAPAGGFTAFDDSRTVATALRQAGYSTALVGKYLNGYGNNDPTYVPPGWSDWRVPPGDEWHEYRDVRLNENGQLGDRLAGYSTDDYADITDAIISRGSAQDRPFFVWTSYLAPHAGGPVEPDDPRPGGPTAAVPERYRDFFDSARLPTGPAFNEVDVSDKPQHVRRLNRLDYDEIAALREAYQQRLESLLALDDAVEQTIATLARTGELDNTLVVFTSDNGYLLGEHRLAYRKSLPYEPSLAVPLLVRGPGVPAGVRRDQPVASIDLAPTFVDAAEASSPLAMDGTSLLPLAASRTAGSARDIVVEAGSKSGDGGTFFTGLRSARWLYVKYAGGEQELYDMANDPQQLQSLHADPGHDARQARLAERLVGLQQCSGAACR